MHFAYIWALANRLGTCALEQLLFCAAFYIYQSHFHLDTRLSLFWFEVTYLLGDFCKPFRNRTRFPIHCPSGDALKLKGYLTPEVSLHNSGSSDNTGKEEDNWKISGPVVLNPDTESSEKFTPSSQLPYI